MTSQYPIIDYSPESDAIYVALTDRLVSRQRHLDDYRILDLAEDGSIVGVELLGVSGGVDLTGLPNQAVLRQAVEPIIAEIARRQSESAAD
jgi:uncharacterized protein YuzE